MLDLDMGKHAVYVWGAYGAAFVSLCALIVLSLRIRAKRRAALKALQDAVDSGS